MVEDKKLISIQLEKQLLEKFKKLAKQNSISVSAYIRLLLINELRAKANEKVFND